jgi:hypothetical protein
MEASMGTRASARLRIRRESIETTIRRLETYVARFEARYETPSDVALEAVRSGQMKETAEINRWLMSYQVLQSLRAERQAGRGIGAPTSVTR